MNKIIILALTSYYCASGQEVTKDIITEMTPEGEALLSGQEPLLGMKDLYVEHILINGIPYELYEDFDKNGNKYYYLMLTYGEDKFGGFLADRFGNLIDFEGNILTSIEDMSEILQDYDAGELLDTEDDLLRGILIKKIVGAEQIGAPDEELELGMDACCLKSSCLPKLEFCSCKQQCCLPKCNCFCNPCCVDGCVTKEYPVPVQKKVYYDKPCPYPVYKKKIIPYTVTKKCPVYIKKCVPCHIPVKVPVKCPVNICVPCYKPYTTIVPVQKNVYRCVPKVYYKQKVVYEKVPKVCTVRVPCVRKQIVQVPCPYKVVQKCPCVKTVTNVVKVPYKVTKCIPVKKTKYVKEYVDCCEPCCTCAPCCKPQCTCDPCFMQTCKPCCKFNCDPCCKCNCDPCCCDPNCLF